MDMLYLAVGGLIALVFVLYGFVFFLRKKQIKDKKLRLEGEARAAIKEADADRGFVPHK